VEAVFPETKPLLVEEKWEALEQQWMRRMPLLDDLAN
jgi:hypothetical protein